ncbi:stage 0 sporulation protein f, putative [Heliomicrobium modesticaldum Ice1]|uniref:Stage 0 sporulation protein A homolog n=1 Tax=Heliobacterium modesticaldum (strain ATCC 51547 / Ice1) TaxID=498761 RepID=B0TE89_HELMI|nr:response regulator [Heliomicrobium modesticaldum]ABZ84284.1 stage 0 sporulation protein f, putative [Heliomicrobium modesticaldum Ice1]
MEAGKRILVVDDQAGVRSLLRIILQDAGYHVYTAANGIEAVRKAGECNIPFVLMDVRMPGLDGVQAMLQMMKQNPYIKVVLMTAFSDESLIQQALQDGAIGYLIKPFDVYQLREEIDRMWNATIGNGWLVCADEAESRKIGTST